MKLGKLGTVKLGKLDCETGTVKLGTGKTGTVKLGTGKTGTVKLGKLGTVKLGL